MKNSRYFDLPQALFTKITSYKSPFKPLPKSAGHTLYNTGYEQKHPNKRRKIIRWQDANFLYKTKDWAYIAC